MRKQVATLLTVVFLFSIGLTANAAVKPGTSCKKLGQISISSGKKYTCVKSGKKLVWNKGLLVKKPITTFSITPTPIVSATPIPTPSPTLISSPTPSPTQTSSPTPSPTPTPTAEVLSIPPEPKNLDDLILRPDSMSYWAWEKSNQIISKSKTLGPTASIFVGPQTLNSGNFLQTSINLVAKLYEGFNYPLEVNAIYFYFDDINWAQQTWSKSTIFSQGNETSILCKSSGCFAALAEIDLKGKGLLLFAGKDPLSGRYSQSTGAVTEAHEYTHTIQATQFVGTSKQERAYCCIKAYMPWWMVEGNAAFTQAAATFSTSYKDYLEERVRIINELQVNSNNKFTQQWLQNYLDTSTTLEWDKPENSWRMYDVGYLVNEALASFKGPMVNMQLFKDVAEGRTWEEAFQSNVGISWNAALPKLAEIIYKLINK